MTRAHGIVPVPPFVYVVVFVFCGHFDMSLCWWSKRKKEIASAISFEVF
jgi:hypothetical protein